MVDNTLKMDNKASSINIIKNLGGTICEKPTEKIIDGKANATIKSKNTKTTIAGKVSTTDNAVKKYSYVFDKGRTDKRVSLNVSPLVNGGIDINNNNFIDRVTYVLGQRKLSNRYVYGFLYGCLNKSCGLIFPYTPSITFNHTVNYEKTDIIHSNLHAITYKNTPPPSISLNATFTADTRDNALHMLSAIWFLRAVTKCDFGEQNVDKVHQPGMPPPVLYLNGYNQVMDNIPVVVENFSYTLPEDKDYVALGINLNTTSNKFIYQEQNINEKQSGDIMLNGIKTALQNITGDTTTILSNGNPNGKYYFNNWLPTELKVSLQLTIVPNLLKYKKQFDLNKYKMGIYNLPKLVDELFIPTSNGNINTDCIEKEDLIEYVKQQAITSIESLDDDKSFFNYAENEIKKMMKDKSFSDLSRKNQNKIRQEKWNSIYDNQRNKIVQEATNQVENIKNGSMENSLKESLKPKTYKFDKSGWTW